MNKQIKTQVIVIGSGPSGYSAAFRCVDLGMSTLLVEKYSDLGGVCLNVGCIPSKTLLHLVKTIDDVKNLKNHGIDFTNFFVDIKKINIWKKKVIDRLNNGLKDMAKKRSLRIIQGLGEFITSNTMIVENEKNKITIEFDYAIIAIGSRPIRLPFAPDDKRIWNSTDALELKKIPEKLLIIGGGVIGLEIGTIYQTLGSKIDIVEMHNQIIPMADEDVIHMFTKAIEKKFNIMLEKKIKNIESKNDALHVTIEDKNFISHKERYDAVLIAVGRKPNNDLLNLKKIGIRMNKNGFICVNKQMCTNIPHIYAVGDITGEPMLAHKGTHQGHIAAEVIYGKNHYFDPKVIPSIAYTNPEISWVGITEKYAKEKGIHYESSIFPWVASGRANASNYVHGMTKLIFNKKTGRIIGGAIVGVNSGELLGEITLAIEMGCYAEDISLTIHAHPTLYESIGLSAEIFLGSITDLPNPKSKIKMQSSH